MSARVAQGSSRKNGAASARQVALTVRQAGPGDVLPLGFFFDTVLRKDYFLRRGQLEDLVRDEHHHVYVAEIDTVLVGAAVTSGDTRLVNVLVHPAYRGLGIGQQLVRQTGATEVRAKTDMSTGDPRGFYEALGFVSTGEFNSKGNIELMRQRDNGNGVTRGGRRPSHGKQRTPVGPRRTGTGGKA